jgi:hypothetical protein
LGYPILYEKDEEVKEKMIGGWGEGKVNWEKKGKKFSEKLEINLPIGLISLYTCAVYIYTAVYI